MIAIGGFAAAGVQIEDGVETSAQDRQKVLFAQMIVTRNVEQASRILTQIGRACDGRDENTAAAHHWRTREIGFFVGALDDMLTDCQNSQDKMWELGNNFVRAALSSKRAVGLASRSFGLRILP